jgi:hypothetical protein
VGETRSTGSSSDYCPHPSNHFRDHSDVSITNISCPTYPNGKVCATYLRPLDNSDKFFYLIDIVMVNGLAPPQPDPSQIDLFAQSM